MPQRTQLEKARLIVQSLPHTGSKYRIKNTVLRVMRETGLSERIVQDLIDEWKSRQAALQTVGENRFVAPTPTPTPEDAE